LPPIAEALVRILPDTRDFAATLERKIKAEVRNTTVPAITFREVAVTRSFVDELKRKVNAAVAQVQKGIKPITVGVEVPQPRRAVTTGAERAAREATAPPTPARQVAATQTGAAKDAQKIRDAAGAQDKATESTKRQTAAERELAVAIGQVERAELRLQNTTNVGLGLKTRDQQLRKQLTSLGSQQSRAAEILSRTQATGDAAAIRGAERLQGSIQKRIDAINREIAAGDKAAQQAATNAAKEATARERQEAREKTAEESRKQRLADQQTRQTQLSTQLAAGKRATDTLTQASEQLAISRTRVTSATTQEAAAERAAAETKRINTLFTRAEQQAADARDKGLVRSVARRKEAALTEIQTLRDSTQAQIRDAAIARERQRSIDQESAITNRATKLRRQGQEALAKTDALATTASSQLAAAEIRLGQTRAASQKFILAEEAARAGNNRQLQTELRSLNQETQAKLRAAEASVVEERALQRETRARSQLTRGAGASSLTFAGLRGATLAASKEFLIGTAAVVAFAGALKEFATLEETLNTFRATTGATREEMEAVEAAAIRLGRDITLPAVSATDAANAMTSLAKAGLSVRGSIAAARGVLQLATAAGIDNAQATELTASALNAFGLQGRQAIQVADFFANAANAAQGSIVDFGVALQQSAAIAHQTGISLRDTVGFLTLFARAGLRGSDAGTSLRTSLIRLINPTDEAAALIEDLGIQIRDTQGNIRPDVFAQFGEATAGLSNELRDMFAATIFGQDAIRAVLIAARAGRAGLADVQEQLSRQGTAAEVAAARTEGLTGKAEQLKNTLAGLGITIGEDVAPAVSEVAEAATEFFESLNAGIQTTENLLAPLRPLAPALEAVTGAIAKGLLPVAAIVLAYKAFGLAINVSRAAAVRGRAIGALLAASNTKVAVSENAVAAANTRTAATIADLIAGERLQVATNRALTGSIADVIAAQNLQAVSAGRAGAANIGGAASGGLPALIGRAGTARAALGLLGGAFTGALVAATAFGVVIEILGRRTSETERATEALTAAIQKFEQAATGRNLNALRRSVEETAAAFAKAFAGPQPGASRIDLLESQLERVNNQIRTQQTILAREQERGGPTEAIKALLSQLEQQRAGLEGSIERLRPLARREGIAADARSVEAFVRQIRELAEANRDIDPVLAHNLDLLADLSKAIGAVPTGKEIKVIFDNKATKTSLEQIMIQIGEISPEENARIRAAFQKRAQIGIQAFLDVAHGVVGVPFEFQIEPKLNAQAVDRQLRDALNQLEGIDLQLPPAAIPRLTQRLITQLAQGGPEGRRRLRQIGLELMDGLREGLDEGGEDAVKSARENLQNVIQQGEEALRQSVRTARGNIASFSQELIGQIDQVIDQMDFGVPQAQRQVIRLGLGVDLRDAQQALRQARREGLAGDALEPFIDSVESAEAAMDKFAKSGRADIETLQRSLAELQRQQQRRQLVRGVESAQRELDKLRGSLMGTARFAPGGSPVISQMLADQKALVTDAKAELKSFDLTSLIQNADRVRAAYKKAKDEGVKKLVDEFLRGKRTAADFEKQLRTQLAPVLEDLPKKNLGMGFTQAFKSQIEALVKQAGALAGFLGIPGTVGPEIERPAKTVQDNIEKRLKAAEDLQKAIDKQTKGTEKNTGDTVTVLKFIAKTFAGRPLTKAEKKAISKADPSILKLFTDAK
jgi:TP901 family phage tail tape measure protein